MKGTNALDSVPNKAITEANVATKRKDSIMILLERKGRDAKTSRVQDRVYTYCTADQNLGFADVRCANRRSS